MAILTVVDSHNMVEYLQKSEANADFAEIVDFLNASPIKYALTITPTIYVSYIEQFWSTAKTKTVNNGTQIRAKVDGKTIVITESSVKSDLYFDDEDGYTCLTNTEIFKNLPLMGYEKLFNEAIHEERGDSVERDATTAASLDAKQDSVDLENVKDAQALEIKRLKKRVKILERRNKSRTPQLKRRVYKPIVESSEESLGAKDASKQGRNNDKTKELNVAKDEHMFDLSDLAGTKVIVDQEEPTGLVEDKGSVEKGVSAAKDKDNTDVDVSVGSPTRLVDDSTTDDVTLAETLMAIRSSASRSQNLKGVVFKEPSEPKTTSRPQPHILIIYKEKESCKSLRKKEREHMSVEEQARLLMEFIAARKKFFAAKRAKKQRNKPPTKAEQRKKMCTYMKHMARYKDKNFKGKSFDVIKQMFDKAYKQVNDFVPMDIESSGKKVNSSGKKAESSKKRTRAALSEESVKRQKVKDDAQKAELKSCLEIVPNDDSAINI
nr:hypothetical protein [Tanacetum cinerariifolium]